MTDAVFYCLLTELLSLERNSKIIFQNANVSIFSPPSPTTDTIVTFSISPSVSKNVSGLSSLDDLNSTWAGLPNDLDSSSWPLHVADTSTEISSPGTMTHAQYPEVRE